MEPTLDRRQQETLLYIARTAIDTRVRTGVAQYREPTDEMLRQPRGCFVTIKKGGRLRGCIGNFVSHVPLSREVADMAVAAATKDPRFYPLQVVDLERFTIEISVLSPLHRIESIEEIQIGRHGLFLEKGFARGVLLPQVATEYGWDRQTFLRQVSVKAGLEPDDWQEQEAVIHRFCAQVFSEQ